MRTIGSSIAHYLLPNICVSCERDVGGGPDTLVCGVCRSRWRQVPRGCTRCGNPEPPIGPCRFCVAWPPWLAWVRSAVWLGEEARDAVHHLKYEGLHDLAHDLAGAIARAVPSPPKGVIVPIPLSRHRERRRGYNQSAYLARAIARRWNRSCSSVLLTRERETRSQTSLDPAERAANVAGAFRGRPVPTTTRERVARIILVDDILTTGATLVAAAEALHEAGWDWVGAITFARATPYAVRGMLAASVKRVS